MKIEVNYVNFAIVISLQTQAWAGNLSQLTVYNSNDNNCRLLCVLANCYISSLIFCNKIIVSILLRNLSVAQHRNNPTSHHCAKNILLYFTKLCLEDPS